MQPQNSDTPADRQSFGFTRTVCGCEICRAPCRHMPGSLAVDDILRLCPDNADPFRWAEEHLRALTDKDYPTLVPARQTNGHCHWLFDGKCVVHANAPYGCAFFDCHQPPDEVERRSAATIRARLEDKAENGLYYRLWLHLCRLGLIGVPGDRVALGDEIQVLRGAFGLPLNVKS